MSDYRNPDFEPFDPNDPYRRNPKTDPDLRPSNTVTGWVVAVVFVVALLGVIFGVSREHATLGTNTASNEMAQPGASPAETHMAAPADSAKLRTRRWISSLAPMSTPCVGSWSRTTRGSSWSHLASSTFCWLPPLRELVRTVIIARARDHNIQTERTRSRSHNRIFRVLSPALRRTFATTPFPTLLPNSRTTSTASRAIR